MTDRTRELVAEYYTTMDVRTYDQKTKATFERVIDHFDGRIHALANILVKVHEALEEQEERISELEKQIGTM